MSAQQQTANTGDASSAQQAANNGASPSNNNGVSSSNQPHPLPNNPHPPLQGINQQNPQQIVANPDPNQSNLAAGNVKRINIAEKIKHDELMIRVFKWLAYAACMILGVWFLIVGLLETKSLLDTQINTAQNQAALIEQQTHYYKTINDYNDLVNSKKVDSSVQKIASPAEKKENSEKPLADKIISASAVLTMLAFILGVGLTLLLTLLKFSFNNNKDNTAEITSPYGKLIIEIGEALRDKFKK